MLAIDLKAGFLETGGTYGLVLWWVREDFPHFVTLHWGGMDHVRGCLPNCQFLSLFSLSLELQELEIEFLVCVGRISSAGHLSTAALDIKGLETRLMLMHNGRHPSKFVGACCTSQHTRMSHGTCCT